MPVPPKAGNALRKKRRPEIVHQGYPQYLRRPLGDDGITCKIPVNLKQKQYRRNHHIQPFVMIRILPDTVYHQRRPVRQHQLQKISPDHEKESILHPFPVKPVCLAKLVHQVLGTLNGPCHQLGEKGYEQGIAEYIFLARRVFSVYIYHIPHGLKGKKRDSHRQQNIVLGPLEPHAQTAQQLVAGI